ncbi:hypothetical protein SGGMMB4_00488 [Sodalis glossinidius str. 'morsitans']|uniref:Uncharacterized protein n=1 Tax=Sodalis glossinidius (strain morsitans) TaxID=343509 RepID=A0A193QF75_SODGM|nr:hypothetical protein [Sodalis glossinidius]CRL43821.1 hypothetical protein SGGMMB4_00488 [Sodalis glossinidius str. 'morsitans']
MVGQSYLAQARWLCAAGWHALSDDEQAFLRQATIHLVQLGFLLPSQHRPEGSRSEHVYRQKENVDIFTAVWADEERRYATVNAYDGYSVKRIDSIEDHLEELVEGVSQAQVEIRVSPVLQMKSQEQNLTAFFEAIAQRHQQMFTSRLGEYEKLTVPNTTLYQTLVSKMAFTTGVKDNPAALGTHVNFGCCLNRHLLVVVMANMAASAKNDAERSVIDAVITGIRSDLLLAKKGEDVLCIPLPHETNSGQPAAPRHRNTRALDVECRLNPDVESIYALSKAAVAHIVAIGYAASECLYDNGGTVAKLDDRPFLDLLPDAPVSDLVALSGQFKLTLPFQRICPHGVYVKTLPEIGVLYGPQFMLQQRQKTRIGLIEKIPGQLDVYFMFPSTLSGAKVMRLAHIALDLAGIATDDIPPLRRFVSLRSTMHLRYISEKKICAMLNRNLGIGQYFVASHDDLKQSQKATAAYPTSYLHLNKQRFTTKTDEARETVLALKQLFTEVDFLPHDPKKSLSQAPALPSTCSIYHYLLDALGLTPTQDKIIQFAARWLCYYTERIEEEFAATPLAEKVLFVSHKAYRAYNKNKPSLMGFTFRNDKNRQLFLLADSFDDDIPVLPRMHLLHEAKQRPASINYLHAPISTYNGQLNECVEIYEDREDIRDLNLVYYDSYMHFINRYRRALLNPGTAQDETDKAVRQRQNNAVREMSKAAFIKQVWRDDMLRVNVLLDNADMMAKVIEDVGRGMRYIPDGQTRSPGARLSQLPRKLYALIIASGRRHKPARRTPVFPGIAAVR